MCKTYYILSLLRVANEIYTVGQYINWLVTLEYSINRVNIKSNLIYRQHNFRMTKNEMTENKNEIRNNNNNNRE